jgi:hypothetical protein
MFLRKMESPPWVNNGEMPLKTVTMEYCKEEIEWYEQQVRFHWWPWLVINIILISASAITTMLAANPDAIESDVIRAIPASVVFFIERDYQELRRNLAWAIIGGLKDWGAVRGTAP